MASELRFLPLNWEIWIEFLGPGLLGPPGLPQSWLLWAFGKLEDSIPIPPLFSNEKKRKGIVMA